ncbi:MAG: transcription-repair coupling factor, partial [Desulfovibrionales bacterium]
MFLNKDIQALLDSSSTAARVYKSGLGSQAKLAAAALQKKRNVVVIVPGRQELLSIKALLSLLSPTEKENFWEQEWTFLDPSPIEQLTRGRCTFWAPIFSLLQGESPRGVVLTLENLFFKFPSHKALNKEYLYLIQGETLSMEEIVETGLKWGYQRVGIVTRPGEFAVRGDILDIFAPGYKQPVRLEFFGDLIERVRLFDPMSQRSQAILSEFLLLPVAPCVLGEEYEQEAREKWNSRW